MLKSVFLNFIDFILGPVYGKKQYQSLFGFLHSLSIKGMNLRYSPIGDNGEEWLIKKINSFFQDKNVVPIIFDVGANSGEYSKSFIKISQHKISLHSFEPSLKSFKVLQETLEYVNASVNLHNIGFSDKATRAKLAYNIKDPTTSSLYTTKNDQNVIMEDIILTTIDDFCALQGIVQINFLKIDVEGNEVKVLVGAMGMIKLNYIDFIQFEFGPRNVDSRTFFRDFYSLLGGSYSIYRILKNGLYPLHPYHQDYEAFFAGNYLAVSHQVNISEFLRR